MTKINLRKYYPRHEQDHMIEVSEEIALTLREFELREEAYRIRTYRHGAYYSLDRGDDIETHALFTALSPQEMYERKLTREQLYAALASLPDKQAKRVYAHYFLGMSKTAIARAEGVAINAVAESITRGLVGIQK